MLYSKYQHNQNFDYSPSIWYTHNFGLLIYYMKKSYFGMQTSFSLFWKTESKLQKGLLLQSQVPIIICWLMVIPWCVTLAGCRGRFRCVTGCIIDSWPVICTLVLLNSPYMVFKFRLRANYQFYTHSPFCNFCLFFKIMEMRYQPSL